MSADVDLQCSEVLTNHLILVQVNGAREGKPEEDEDIVGWKAPAGEVDEYLRALNSIVSNWKACKVKCRILALHGRFEGLCCHLTQMPPSSCYAMFFKGLWMLCHLSQKSTTNDL